MKNLNIKDIKVKFNEFPDASRITFQTKDGKKAGYLDLGDEAGFVTEDEAMEIEEGDWYDCIDDIYGDSEEEWEAAANEKLEGMGVKIGAYHDEPFDYGYHELEAARKAVSE